MPSLPSRLALLKVVFDRHLAVDQKKGMPIPYQRHLPIEERKEPRMNTVAFDNYCADGLPRVPPDIAQCARLLQANCGPVSLAAVLGTTVIEVMKFFPHFPRRDYTTLADMHYALSCISAMSSPSGNDFPSTGMALVQLDGPWTVVGVPVRAQLRYTHWVACRSGFLFDINVGDWIEIDEWTNRGAMSWMKSVRQCTGFHPRAALSITPQRFEFSPFGRVPLRSSR